MARKFLTPLTPPSLSSDPASAIVGSIYYNTSSNLLKFYNGTAWVPLTSSSNTVTEHTHDYDGNINYVGTLQYSSTNLFDGGSPSSVFESSMDGGSPTSTYITTIDGGSL